VKVFQIASIPGDGIGMETVAAGRRVLDTLCEVHGGLRLDFLDPEWSCGKKVTSATKSNGINFTMPFWDEIFTEVGEAYPDISRNQFHIDALCARFVTHPHDFEVVVGSNLFGDILTDLGPAIAGSIGVAPSANINPTKEFPSMFEPVHGSAPDIAGKGIANPMGQIWCGAMMLDHLRPYW
jgi:tartrate dehydrogenase/decarboxylase/D-malate dehydrogenase